MDFVFLLIVFSNKPITVFAVVFFVIVYLTLVYGSKIELRDYWYDSEMDRSYNFLNLSITKKANIKIKTNYLF